jgi:hypothetical protein
MMARLVQLLGPPSSPTSVNILDNILAEQPTLVILFTSQGFICKETSSSTSSGFSSKEANNQI